MTSTPSPRVCKIDGKKWAVAGSEYCSLHMPSAERYVRARAQ